MIQWRWYNFKTARFRPSIATQFYVKQLNNEEYTPTQKLMLARRRIFGCSYGDGYKSGRSEFKRHAMTKGERRYQLVRLNAIEPLRQYPLLQDPEPIEWRRILFEARKLRVMMRGVKVGRKKGGGRVNLMSVFQTKGGGGVTATTDKKEEDN